MAEGHPKIERSICGRLPLPWMRGTESNRRPLGNEPSKLPTAPPRRIAKKRTSPATNLPPIIDRWGRLREKCADTYSVGK